MSDITPGAFLPECTKQPQRALALWSVPAFHLIPLPGGRVTTCQVKGNLNEPCRGDGMGTEMVANLY